MFKEPSKKLADGQDLSPADADLVMRTIMEGKASQAPDRRIPSALHMKVKTADE